MQRHVLLSGVVGSTAYGLAGPDSDVDRLGLFAYDTLETLRLVATPESIVQHEPDVTLHEARKYVGLALGGNPTVMELMWLPEYEVITPLGKQLIGIRNSFLSAKRVRDAYLGYATQQFTRLKNRADGSFAADLRKRTAKHARHLMRLCYQGYNLYATGELIIRLDQPEMFREFGEAVAEGDTRSAELLMDTYKHYFDTTPPAIPDEPDQEAAEQWLLEVRRHYWNE